MARKNYSDEFRRQAVDLYGTGKKTAADGTLSRSPLKPSGSSSSRTSAGAGSVQDETSEQQIRRLEDRVAELEVETTKLTTEREILQRAAKYFAGETRWCLASSSSPTTKTPSR